MLFNSVPFLLFFPAFILAYYLTHGRVRLWVSLLASYLFYGWWDPRFLLLVGATTLLDYTIGRLIAATDVQERRKRLLVASVVSNLMFLGFFKYFNFFVNSLEDLARSLGVPVSHTTLAIIVPVGISFYTFKSLSYTIDVYRRELPAEPSLLRFAVFVCFWPELVAGPIVRGSEFLPQLQSDRRASYEDVQAGLAQMLRGFVRKVVIADTLAPVVAHHFTDPGSQNAINLVIGAVFFAYQIYNDFAGYSDIAIGAARILGIRFPQNFDRPYTSQSMTEFWRRWHITLSRWLRDYLYIPLGGNRGGTSTTYRNLMLTMMLGGLWHGPAWTFAAWGALQGIYLVGERVTGVADTVATTPVRKYARRFVVFGLWTFSMIFFRAASFHDAWSFITGMLDLHTLSPALLGLRQQTLKGFGVIALSMLIDRLTADRRVTMSYLRRPQMQVALSVTALWIVLLAGNFGTNSFIYFQF